MLNNIKLTGDLLHDVFERTTERKNKGVEFSLTGISPMLDYFLYGLQRGKLTIIGGRPSNGKSAFMGDMAYNLVMAGHKVGFISLEMESIDIAERITSRAFCINNRDFVTGIATEKIYKEKFADIPTLSEKFKKLAITQNIGFTFKELDEVVKKYLSTHDVIIIDYLQMIKGSATAKENMDEYIKHLRQLAVETNKAIVLGSQINRAGASKDNKETIPSMTDLKGSGCIEEVADVVILVHWQYFYTKKPDDKNKYLVIVAKNRATGLTGFVPLKFEPEYYRFSEVKDAQQTSDNQENAE